MPQEKDFIPFARPDVTEAEVNAAAEAIRSGWLTTGAASKQFEKDFAAYLGDESLECVAVNSCTAALHLALEAAGVGAGDEVLVPTWTFTSTAEVVRYLGAHPVLVDVDAQTLNIDLAAAAEKVSERTKAIMPVHFSGRAMSPSALSEFARTHVVEVIEDAAHSLPARSEGVTVGTGDSLATAFSFYATKTITTGEGGMLVTRRPDIAARARTMRLHGISRDVFDRYSSKTPSWRYEVVAPGFKYNLTDPAAAMGSVQLIRSDAMRNRRREIATRYQEAFFGLPVELPADAPAGDMHAWHLFVLRIGAEAPRSRDDAIAALAEAGIGTSVHFIPLHLHPYWRDTYELAAEDFPVATAQFEQAMSLPIFSSMSDADVERVCSEVQRILR